LAIREQRCFAGDRIEAIELIELAAADIALDDEIGAGRRLIARGFHAIGEEGQLPAIAARGSHQVRLIDIGEARADQNFSTRRVPILKARASEFGVAPDRFGDAHGDRRDAVYDEVFVWGDVRPLGQGDDGYEQRQTSQHRAASEAGAEQSSKPLQNPKLSVADVDRSGRYNAALIVQQLEFE